MLLNRIIIMSNIFFQSESGSNGNPRGGIYLEGALICPSDEDSHTFTVNSSTGEVFKLRATDARARQEWVNRLRSVAEYHSSNLTKVSKVFVSMKKPYKKILYFNL